MLIRRRKRFAKWKKKKVKYLEFDYEVSTEKKNDKYIPEGAEEVQFNGFPCNGKILKRKFEIKALFKFAILQEPLICN